MENHLKFALERTVKELAGTSLDLGDTVSSFDDLTDSEVEQLIDIIASGRFTVDF